MKPKPAFDVQCWTLGSLDAGCHTPLSSIGGSKLLKLGENGLPPFSWSQVKMAYSTLYFGLYMDNNYVNFNCPETVRSEHSLLSSLKWVFSCLNYPLSPESFTKAHCLVPSSLYYIVAVMLASTFLFVRHWTKLWSWLIFLVTIFSLN